jgi:hypothetical protein
MQLSASEVVISDIAVGYAVGGRSSVACAHHTSKLTPTLSKLLHTSG